MVHFFATHFFLVCFPGRVKLSPRQLDTGVQMPRRPGPQGSRRRSSTDSGHGSRNAGGGAAPSGLSTTLAMNTAQEDTIKRQGQLFDIVQSRATHSAAFWSAPAGHHEGGGLSTAAQLLLRPGSNASRRGPGGATVVGEDVLQVLAAAEGVRPHRRKKAGGHDDGTAPGGIRRSAHSTSLAPVALEASFLINGGASDERVLQAQATVTGPSKRVVLAVAEDGAPLSPPGPQANAPLLAQAATSPMRRGVGSKSLAMTQQVASGNPLVARSQMNALSATPQTSPPALTPHAAAQAILDQRDTIGPMDVSSGAADGHVWRLWIEGQIGIEAAPTEVRRLHSHERKTHRVRHHRRACIYHLNSVHRDARKYGVGMSFPVDIIRQSADRLRAAGGGAALEPEATPTNSLEADAPARQDGRTMIVPRGGLSLHVRPRSRGEARRWEALSKAGVLEVASQLTLPADENFFPLLDCVAMPAHGISHQLQGASAGGALGVPPPMIGLGRRSSLMMPSTPSPSASGYTPSGLDRGGGGGAFPATPASPVDRRLPASAKVGAVAASSPTGTVASGDSFPTTTNTPNAFELVVTPPVAKHNHSYSTERDDLLSMANASRRRSGTNDTLFNNTVSGGSGGAGESFFVSPTGAAGGGGMASSTFITDVSLPPAAASNPPTRATTSMTMGHTTTTSSSFFRSRCQTPSLEGFRQPPRPHSSLASTAARHPEDSPMAWYADCSCTDRSTDDEVEVAMTQPGQLSSVRATAAVEGWHKRAFQSRVRARMQLDAIVAEREAQRLAAVSDRRTLHCLASLAEDAAAQWRISRQNASHTPLRSSLWHRAFELMKDAAIHLAERQETYLRFCEDCEKIRFPEQDDDVPVIDYVRKHIQRQGGLNHAFAASLLAAFGPALVKRKSGIRFCEMLREFSGFPPTVLVSFFVDMAQRYPQLVDLHLASKRWMQKVSAAASSGNGSVPGTPLPASATPTSPAGPGARRHSNWSPSGAARATRRSSSISSPVPPS